MLTGNDRLARVWGPAVEAIVPRSELDRRKVIKRAIGEDGIIRTDALPDATVPWVIHWIDTSTVTTGEYSATRYFCAIAYQLREVHAIVGTAPTGSSIIVHIETELNETLASVSIAAGETLGSTTGLAIDIDPTTWLRGQIDQVGSSTTGQDLTFCAVLYPLESV